MSKWAWAGGSNSTNIVNGEIAIVTNIGLEHTEILGSTREAIAREKVGVLKRGAALITTLGPEDEAGRVLQAKADELGSPVRRPRLDAAATIDETNVALASAALDQLGRRGVRARSAPSATRSALGFSTPRPAPPRVSPGAWSGSTSKSGSRRLPVVLDGAHVPFNLAAVMRDLARAPDLSGPCVAVVALAADKDAKGFVAELGRRAATIVFTDLPGSSRGRSPADLGARGVARRCERGRAGRQAR